MRSPLLLFFAAAVLAGSPAGIQADVIFTGSVDSDFTTLGNWDDSGGGPATNLPGAGNNGTINGGLTSDLASDHLIGSSTLFVGASGSAGTLNINSGGTLRTSNGGASDVRVGVGAGSVGTINVNNGGTLSVLGAGADLFLGDAAGGLGTVNIGDGATLDARKAVEIIDGTLSFSAAALYAANRPQDELVVGDNGTLAFATDGATNLTIGSTLNALELGAGSTLHMNLGGSYNVGDTWTLITGIDAFTDLNGGIGTGVFGNVLDPNNASNQFTVHYGSGSAAAGELVVELVAVPEPSSAIILFASCATLISRRRKKWAELIAKAETWLS